MKHAYRVLGALLLALAVLAAPKSASAQSADAVKAAFIFNFSKFISWPDSAFSSPTAPFEVAFVNANKLADIFEKSIAGKNANGRMFKVRKVADASGIDGCHIVIVGAGADAEAVVSKVKGTPVLTVGDLDAFVAAGGVIGFVMEGAKVRFDLNLGSAEAGQLSVNPKLKGLARKVVNG